MSESIDELENTASTGAKRAFPASWSPPSRRRPRVVTDQLRAATLKAGDSFGAITLAAVPLLRGKRRSCGRRCFGRSRPATCRNIVRALIGRAKTGDTVAARIVLGYLRQHGITLPQTETLSEGELTHDDS